MKSISAGLATHLEGTLTSLATIWRIARIDGESFYFTDHDQDLLFEGNVYKARSGYNRTSISNNVGLSVDNLDVEGVFDSEDISEVDLRAGLFDYAEIKISLVNWSDLSQGELKQRRGKLGEVILTQNGIFRAELRGLAQQLSQAIVEVYQAECRADLGGTQCSVVILPNVLGRLQPVLLGESYRVPTGLTSNVTYTNLVVNGGFELDTVGSNKDALIGWKIVMGPVNIADLDDSLSAYEGANYFRGGSGLSCEIQQDIPLANSFGIDLAQVDLGNVTSDFSCRRANNAVDDTGRVVVQFLDTDLNPLSTMYDSTAEEITPVDTWVARSASTIPVPANTRFIRIRFIGTRVTGPQLNTCLDAVALTLTDAGSENTFQDVYEDRVYEVTSAGTTNASQPTYNTAIGAATAEASAPSSGTVELTGGAAGSVDSITVDSVEVMSAAVPFDTDLETTATNVASNITANTSAPNYTAAAAGTIVTITATIMGATTNGFAVVSAATTLSTADTSMANGSDGATLVARDSFMRSAVITNITDQKTFNIAVDDARAVDDWFNNGALIFESGLNEATVSEIRSWDAATGEIKLFLPLPFTMYNGTKVRLYPGCDKRVATCVSRFDNILNFRGEPFVPGQDELTNYPDAR